MSYESVHNFYERVVTEYVLEKFRSAYTPDKLADIVCVALNHLPPKYIRHDVDMSFYMSPQEHLEVNRKVQEAAEDARVFVEAKAHDSGAEVSG